MAFAQQTTTIQLTNGEDIEILYEKNDPNDFRDYSIYLSPISFGTPLSTEGISWSILGEGKFNPQMRASLEIRSLYKKEELKPETVGSDEVTMFAELLALGEYNVWSFEGRGKVKMGVIRKGKYYSGLHIPHAVKNDFNVLAGLDYMTRSGQTGQTPDGTRQVATEFNFTSIMAGISYRRYVNVAVAGSKTSMGKLTLGNKVKTKYSYHIFARLGYVIHQGGEYYSPNVDSGVFVPIKKEEFQVPMNPYILRFGGRYRNYLWENVSITVLLESGFYPGVKHKMEIRDFFPLATGGFAFDL